MPYITAPCARCGKPGTYWVMVFDGSPEQRAPICTSCRCKGKHGKRRRAA